MRDRARTRAFIISAAMPGRLHSPAHRFFFEPKKPQPTFFIRNHYVMTTTLLPTASDLLPHIVRLTKEPEPRVKKVREDLAYGGLLPLSMARGKNPERFGSKEIVPWMVGLGVAVDLPHRAVASVTQEYLDLPG